MTHDEICEHHGFPTLVDGTNCPCQCHKPKVYILKKDCPNIGKETGDYYNGEYAESVDELLVNGIIEEDIIR